MSRTGYTIICITDRLYNFILLSTKFYDKKQIQSKFLLEVSGAIILLHASLTIETFPNYSKFNSIQNIYATKISLPVKSTIDIDGELLKTLRHWSAISNDITSFLFGELSTWQCEQAWLQ